MEKITSKIRETAKQALANKEVDVILGWEKGEFWYDAYPVFIGSEQAAESLIWNVFCVNNLSKYLINELKKSQKIGVFLKGCDALAFNQLVKDNRIEADRVVVYGVPCAGMIDPEKVKKAGLYKGLLEVKRSGDEITFVTKSGEQKVPGRQFDYDKCLQCNYPTPVVYQELMGEAVTREVNAANRFKEVAELEAMSPDERYDYWADQFSKCLRCNACRNICPACSCEKCVFDNQAAGVAGKAKVDSEDQFFHIVRAYHVAGRCVDCGECSRVCPAGIPIHKINRKIIKDINELYGEYDAGADNSQATPLISYKLEDVDPFETSKKGGK